MIDYFTNGLKGAYTAYTEQIHGIQDNLLKCVYTVHGSRIRQSCTPGFWRIYRADLPWTRMYAGIYAYTYIIRIRIKVPSKRLVLQSSSNATCWGTTGHDSP